MSADMANMKVEMPRIKENLAQPPPVLGLKEDGDDKSMSRRPLPSRHPDDEPHRRSVQDHIAPPTEDGRAGDSVAYRQQRSLVYHCLGDGGTRSHIREGSVYT